MHTTGTAGGYDCKKVRKPCYCEGRSDTAISRCNFAAAWVLMQRRYPAGKFLGKMHIFYGKMIDFWKKVIII